MADKDTKTTTTKPEKQKVEDIKPPTKPKAAKEEKVAVSTPKKEELPEAPITGPSPNEALITEPAADAAPAASAPAALSDPVVVSDKEVKTANSDTGNEKLAEEIEVLTGEIQALEAKIEQLANGATSTVDSSSAAPESADVAPINAPQPAPVESKPNEEVPADSAPEAKASEPEKVPEQVQKTEKDFVNKPQVTPKEVLSAGASGKTPNAFHDISPRAKSNESPNDLNPSNEKGSSGSGTGLAIIAEVLAVFGIIVFIILAVSPFFKESVSNDTFQAVQQIGWLTTLGSLALGLILYLFVKGGALFKTLIFILFLMAAVLFLAVNENSLVSPISSYLDSLLEFYR